MGKIDPITLALNNLKKENIELESLPDNNWDYILYCKRYNDPKYKKIFSSNDYEFIDEISIEVLGLKEVYIEDLVFTKTDGMTMSLLLDKDLNIISQLEIIHH